MNTLDISRLLLALSDKARVHDGIHEFISLAQHNSPDTLRSHISGMEDAAAKGNFQQEEVTRLRQGRHTQGTIEI